QISPATTIIFVCSQAPCRAPITFGPAVASNKVHTYSLGPRFSFRNRTRYTPFARALFGGGYISDNFGALSDANGASILTAGGGVDIALTSRLALRTQTDFLRNRFFHQTGPDFRLPTGLGFHFGHKEGFPRKPARRFGSGPLPRQLLPCLPYAALKGRLPAKNAQPRAPPPPPREARTAVAALQVARDLKTA